MNRCNCQIRYSLIAFIKNVGVANCYHSLLKCVREVSTMAPWLEFPHEMKNVTGEEDKILRKCLLGAFSVVFIYFLEDKYGYWCLVFNCSTCLPHHICIIIYNSFLLNL